MYANLSVIYLALHTITGNKARLEPFRSILPIGGEGLVSGILVKHPSG